MLPLFYFIPETGIKHSSGNRPPNERSIEIRAKGLISTHYHISLQKISEVFSANIKIYRVLFPTVLLTCAFTRI